MVAGSRQQGKTSSMAIGDGDGNVFVYMGGEQRRVPGNIRYAFRIHKSVKFIHERAFVQTWCR